MGPYEPHNIDVRLKSHQYCTISSSLPPVSNEIPPASAQIPLLVSTFIEYHGKSKNMPIAFSFLFCMRVVSIQSYSENVLIMEMLVTKFYCKWITTVAQGWEGAGMPLAYTTPPEWGISGLPIEAMLD